LVDSLLLFEDGRWWLLAKFDLILVFSHLQSTIDMILILVALNLMCCKSIYSKKELLFLNKVNEANVCLHSITGVI
jgi:hypothetical protein